MHGDEGSEINSKRSVDHSAHRYSITWSRSDSQCDSNTSDSRIDNSRECERHPCLQCRRIGGTDGGTLQVSTKCADCDENGTVLANDTDTADNSGGGGGTQSTREKERTNATCADITDSRGCFDHGEGDPSIENLFADMSIGNPVSERNGASSAIPASKLNITPTKMTSLTNMWRHGKLTYGEIPRLVTESWGWKLAHPGLIQEFYFTSESFDDIGVQLFISGKYDFLKKFYFSQVAPEINTPGTWSLHTSHSVTVTSSSGGSTINKVYLVKFLKIILSQDTSFDFDISLGLYSLFFNRAEDLKGYAIACRVLSVETSGD
mmetsp:Transcript_11397/g.17339  ORF Transcript_11397/g.17339 Transcript_11397/m.17339 type:complete len:320 (+) Transcript_11397:126-1085(+)